MARLRLAHFSDVHYTMSPLDVPRATLHGKRLANLVSYFLGGRRGRFAGAPARIAALLEDVDACDVDHALCTGDLTSATLEEELTGLAALFGARLDAPDRFTVVPGNHDRYVESAVRSRAFARHFGRLCPGEATGFPFEKRLAGGARLVVLETARPTGLLDSSGLAGPRQRDVLAAMLARDVTSPTIVAMHYGLLRFRGVPDRPSHGLRDYREVLELLDASPARIALVLHGHMHGAFTVPSPRHAIVCAGSATDLLVGCGYFVYDIDLDSLDVRITRRHFDRATGRYVPIECTAFEAAVRDRRGLRLRDQFPLA